MSSPKIAERKLGGFTMELQSFVQMDEGHGSRCSLISVLGPWTVKAVQSRDDFHLYISTACGSEQLALALQPPPSA
jgi:hypothetical protein